MAEQMRAKNQTGQSQRAWQGVQQIGYATALTYSHYSLEQDPVL